MAVLTQVHVASLEYRSRLRQYELTQQFNSVEQRILEQTHNAAAADAQGKLDAIAVFADSNEWIGKVVTVGERVLLIADPAKVELVVWLPVADLLPVRPGDGLTLYPQGSPLESFEATVTSVAYRAEVARDGCSPIESRPSSTPGRRSPASARSARRGCMETGRPWSTLRCAGRFPRCANGRDGERDRSPRAAAGPRPASRA